MMRKRKCWQLKWPRAQVMSCFKLRVKRTRRCGARSGGSGWWKTTRGNFDIVKRLPLPKIFFYFGEMFLSSGLSIKVSRTLFSSLIIARKAMVILQTCSGPEWQTDNVPRETAWRLPAGNLQGRGGLKLWWKLQCDFIRKTLACIEAQVSLNLFVKETELGSPSAWK